MGFFVYDEDQSYIKTFTEQNLAIDHPNSAGYELYGPKGLEQYLKDLKLEYVPLDEGLDKNFGEYPYPEEIYSRLKILVDQNPDILQSFSIGKSSKNRELFVVKISDNVAIDEFEPEFKYIGNMHGNEIVGRDMLVLFIEDLVNRYRAGEKDVVNIINSTEIFIMPTMNPDGSATKSRGNDHWQDLNRNFPDFTTSDNVNTVKGREPETQAVMNWQKSRHFSLSANFHGGSKVVNYPWDTTGDPAPLTDLIRDLSLLYASTVPGFYDNPRFAQGVTNGFRWYHVDGGMQDWSYNWHNDLQVTIELSNNKWPSYSEIPNYYQDNKKALLSFLMKIHQGAGFYFKDPLMKGKVKILNAINKDMGAFVFEKGEFYKVLPSGKYTFNIEDQEGRNYKLFALVTDQITYPLIPNLQLIKK
ncbi:MAG: hypothetical protein K9K67_13830 [Bacteriovoracaceae bacterium]|nr:hypothetical protein [Bacteriovoracaceae bacterium]